MDNNTNIRSRLCARIKNPRVRRMLNMDNIENESDSMGSKQERKDFSNKTFQSELNKEYTITSGNSSLNCTDSKSQDNLKRNDEADLIRTIPMNLRRQEVVKQYEDNTCRELEEPFSPIVSEYMPTSDSSYISDSEDDNRLPKTRINRKSKKVPLKLPMYQMLAEYEVAGNMISSSPKSIQVSNNDITCTPRPAISIYNKISTPDSFKNVLQLVIGQKKSTEKCKTTDNSIFDVNAPFNKQQYNLTNKKNRHSLPNDDFSYNKIWFIASTSTVYLESDLNTEYVGHERLDLITAEIMDASNNEVVSYSNTQFPIVASSSISTNRETNSLHTAFIASETTVYIMDPNLENIEPEVVKQRSRKRKRDESSCQVNKNKLLKNSGKRYYSKTMKKERNCKVMGDPCTCKNKCYEKIDGSARKTAFDAYWGLGNHERQWDFLIKCVKTKPTRVAVVNSQRPRTQTLIYSLPARNGHDLIKVCKKMFLQTLSINERTVFTALMKQEAQTVTDLRGHHKNRRNKIDESTTKSVIDHINLFPRKESHYLRKQTQREYLDEKLNCAKMYRLYVEWMKVNSDVYPNVKLATERWYYHIFNTQFNIGFFQPKKDKCETCSSYESADAERKEQLKIEYEIHLQNKEIVRKIKDEEKESSDATTKTVACFDLEKVLSLPQSDVGIFHYKRKYPVYNFTIYNILTKRGQCYVWHAEIAKRGANEIASCLWSYLQAEAEKGINDVSFYSDNCAGQNRNRFVFALYIHASVNLHLKITHRFLQKGHTQNEGDSMHSCIEKSKKNHVLYIPEELYAIIRNAKVKGTKYKVKEMSQDFFFDFKKLVNNNTNWVKDTSGEKIYWSKIREISVDHSSPGKLLIKYNFDDDTPIVIDTNRRSRVGRRKKTSGCEDSGRPTVLSKLYEAPLPISANLYKDLMSLCRDNHIPPHYQIFYKNLRSQSTAEMLIEDREISSDSEE